MGAKLARLLFVGMLLVLAACSEQKQPAESPTTTPDNSAEMEPTRESADQDQEQEEPTEELAIDPTAEPTDVPIPTATEPIDPGVPIGEVRPVSNNIPKSVTDAKGGQGGDDTYYTFANFNVSKEELAANVSHEAIAPDLNNVELTVLLSPDQQARLAENGFVVSPGDTKEFYEIYERARYNYIPVFVTSDSLLHVYHLLFDKTMRRTETQYLAPTISMLDWELLNTSVAQYTSLQGTVWGEAARRNAAYFAVAVKILNPDWTIPDGLQELVEPDLASIQAHNNIGPSAIFPAQVNGEDWSQYTPRGHYTKSEALTRYFQVMMWHGRMTFRASDPMETRQAALLTHALRSTTVEGMPALDLWNRIYETTVFFVGRSDDLTPIEYGNTLDIAYGDIDVAAELDNEPFFMNFQSMLGDMRPPEILGMVVDRDDPEAIEETQGLRFMGQRFVPDAFVFTKLTHRDVPNRELPKALDVMAAFGSDRALLHLEASGDTAMENYMNHMQDLREHFAFAGEEVWTQNLYWTWIYSLLPLFESTGKGYPAFMRSEAWLDKQLNTALGSWTELKRDTILYAKMTYPEGSGGIVPPPEPEQPKGYVEPVPEVFARIGALSEMTIEGLDTRGMLMDDDRVSLQAMVDLANELERLARKQLRGDSLTPAEYDYLRFYGREIEMLTFAANDDEEAQSGGGGYPMDPVQAAVVADVATNPNGGVVLEEGVGRVFPIYVVTPVEGELVVAQGGVFSHYEFVQPLSDRLTDEAWREMLDRGDIPALADWTSSFIVEQTAEQELADTIIAFNEQLVDAFWYTEANLVAYWLGPEELEDTQQYIENELIAQGEFLGMKRHSMDFRSFDMQDARHATVTTREQWSETRYKGNPDSILSEDDLVLVAEDGPYTLNVTYTMGKPDDHWIINRIVVDSAP